MIYTVRWLIHSLHQIFQDLHTKAKGGAPDRRRKKRATDSSVERPTKRKATATSERVPEPVKSQTKQVKEKTEKIVSYTMVLVHNTAAVDTIHGMWSPNANEFVNLKLLHAFTDLDYIN